eukprot:TRINITY_DN8841_c0_g1_i2.p1 TRINITY_DN8841_c0_g1~~TRINITY_DN8841_c0_g1_i2.p1  ORF type:complete len:534 (-),score=60.54 TRINITY_DN8841_c0_g1_i2:482-2083(-)
MASAEPAVKTEPLETSQDCGQTPGGAAARGDSIQLQFAAGLVGLGLACSSAFSRSDESPGQSSAYQDQDNHDWGVSFFSAGTVEGSPPQWFVCLLVGVLFLWSLREASRVPRLSSCATPTETFRTFLQIVGDVFLAPLRVFLPGEVPSLGYQKTPENEQILSRCPSLMYFKQSPFLRSPFLSFAVLMVKDSYGRLFSDFVRRELLAAPDGGTIALDWWEESPAAPAASASKVMLIGSTLTGDALVTCIRDLCRYFTAAGWRCVVMVKRGCGVTMPNHWRGAQDSQDKAPVPWCLLGFADLKLAVDHVSRTFPGLPICSVGFSAGAGQVRNYVYRMGDHSKIVASVTIDGGPSWYESVESLDRRQPLISKALASVMRMTYAAAGTVADEHEGSLGGVHDFVEKYMAPAHGYERSRPGSIEYLKSCRPADCSTCAVPSMEILTMNDILITSEMALEESAVYERSPHVVTVLTREGTHVVRWEGYFWHRCWLSRVCLEFLEASLQTLDKRAKSSPADCDVQAKKRITVAPNASTGF